MTETEFKWWADKKEWGRIEGTKEAIITSVKILNYNGKKINRIKPKEDFIVKAEFTVKEIVKEPHFGVAIFRKDGIYCYGPNTLFDGYKINYLNEGKGWFSIKYRSIPLLPGNYRLSVAIWDKKEILAYNYHSGLYKFKIIGKNFSNQLFEMAHKWDNRTQKSCLGYDNVLNGIEDIWKKKVRYQNGLDIIRIKLLDINDKSELTFGTDTSLRLKVYLTENKQTDRCVLWIGIFREDGIYCHGAFKELAKNEKEISLFYPKLLLLNGSYLISVGLFEIEEKKIIVCHHGIYPFKVATYLKDHGTVYCDHEWRWELP